MAYKEILMKCVLLVLIWRQGRSCDQGWVEYDDSCYLIFFQKVNKSLAESRCQEYRSVLASISNYERWKFIKTAINEENASTENFWVGLHNVNGQLIWNNRVRAENFSLVDASSGKISTDCFALNSSKVLPLNCTEDAGFICEQLDLQDIDESCPTDAHVDYSSGKCFWYTHMPLTKVGSDVVCSLKYGRLSAVQILMYHNNSATFVNSSVFSESTEQKPLLLWTSLLFRNASLLSEDEVKADSQEVLLGDGECIALVGHNSRMQYTLERKPCLQKSIGLCESRIHIFGERNSSNISVASRYFASDLVKTCPRGGWQQKEGTEYCYWESSHSGAPLSWEESRKYCQSYGGDLVSIHSKDEEEFVFKQHNSAHKYWIGLYYDLQQNKYEWTDKTPLVYVDWAERMQDHGDRGKRCVYLDNTKGQWWLAYCGRVMPFICKVPTASNPPRHGLPAREPITRCGNERAGTYFQSYCYNWFVDKMSWHTAKQLCEEKYGGTLASVNNESEQDFLSRVMSTIYRSPKIEEVWIGLNSFGPQGSFQWTDGSPFGFTNWERGEPNNNRNQEKCVSMSTHTTLWKNFNCNAKFSFVCKTRNDKPIVPVPRTEVPPLKGNCEHGWELFGGKCFRLIGEVISDRKNYDAASDVCYHFGGYLASVRDYKDQAFLFYLIQKVKTDVYIGLHDLDSPGDFYWPDNSPVNYTYWAQHELSDKWKQDNCVAISYGVAEGHWKRIACDTTLPYICQKPPDPSIVQAIHLLGTGCPRAPSFMKQGSCYKVFTEKKSWPDAETTCNKYDGHLVSIYDLEAYAVVNYLAAKDLQKEDTFWIGLKSTNQQSLKWINEWPVSLSRWGKNEPRHNHHQNVCYFTSFSAYWVSGSCAEKRNFICQITIEQPPETPEPEEGGCPLNSSLPWIDIGPSCIAFVNEKRVNWKDASSYCIRKGAHLASFHSMEDIDQLALTLKEAREFVLIGLKKNPAGGYSWSDGSPVDFVNWENEEPRQRDYIEEDCVEMLTYTMKWRVIACEYKRYFLCGEFKDGGRTTEKIISPSTVIAILILFLLPISGGIAFIVFRLRPFIKGWKRFRSAPDDEGSRSVDIRSNRRAVRYRDGKVIHM